MSFVVLGVVSFVASMVVLTLTDTPFWALILTSLPYGAWVAMREEELGS